MPKSIQGNTGVQFNNFITNKKTYDAYTTAGQNSVFTYAQKGNIKNGLEQFGKEYTDVYDDKKNGGDGNGFISEDEFIRKERADYKKMFPDEALDEKTEAEMTDGFKQAFKATDTDGKDGIDQKEMTAYVALMDAQDSKDGTLEGKISYSKFANVSEQLGNLGDTLKLFKNTLFSEPKKSE